MRTGTQHMPYWRELGFMLALVAFALRALIPAGFMPGQTAGHAALVVCAGAGGAHVVDSGKYDPRGDRHDKSAASHEFCGFSFNHAGAAPAPVAWTVPARTLRALAMPAPQIMAAGLARAPYASRAPPVV